MLYFKNIEITDIDPASVERLIRKASMKTHISLDLQTSVSYVRQGKIRFLAQEVNDYIRLTRIKGPLEWLFPKLIIRFNKNDFSQYQIRLGIIASLIDISLLMALIWNIYYSITTRHIENDLDSLLFFTLLFNALILYEYKLSTKRIRKILTITEIC